MTEKEGSPIIPLAVLDQEPQQQSMTPVNTRPTTQGSSEAPNRQCSGSLRATTLTKSSSLNVSQIQEDLNPRHGSKLQQGPAREQDVEESVSQVFEMSR